MKYRKLTRFLALAAASAASLCVGAYLSYQAATQQDAQAIVAVEPSAEVQLEPAVVASAVAPAADTAAPMPDTAPWGALASLEAPSQQILTQSPILRDEAFVPPETPQPELAMRPSQDADVPAAAQELALPEIIPLPPLPGRSAPRPPARPAALAAAAPSPSAATPGAGPAPQQSDSGAFPGIANALQAMASIGGSEGSLEPDAAPATPAPSGQFRKGSPVFVRIFKQEGALELWMKRGNGYALAKSFQICKWSGKLGPKTQQSDYQSPEGFYSVSSRQLNPHSHYHLAFDVGYPNAYDRRHGATGNSIMVHGDCKSVGCFAMTNRGIEEIYSYVAAALANGQREVPVHIFPFRMTEEKIARESGGSILAFLGDGGPQRDWSPFWRNLKQGYDLFERNHVPPVAYACGDRYEFGAGGASCARIAGR